MKKQAIIIQCHNKPEQINKLISVLPDNRFDFYIHVDKKSDIIDKIEHNSNVFFSKRIDVRWGRFSQVQATLELFKMLDTSKYSYVHLISGNDFIIKPIEYIENFFTNNSTEYIQCVKLPEESTWTYGGLDRVKVWYPQFIIRRPKSTFFRFIRILLREFVMRTKVFQRKKTPVKTFYGGSSWFSLTGDCVAWIKEYVKSNPEYINFFKHGVCIDEVFFSTLVRISPYRDNIANRNLVYMRWGESTTGGPAELKPEHIQDMLASDCIFARKFTDIETIEALCRQIF